MNQHGLTRLALPVLFFMSAFVGAAGAQEVKIGYVFTDEIREKASIFQRNQKRFEEQAQRLQDDIRNAVNWIKSPSTLRSAIVASVILGQPKALENQTRW